MKTITAYAVVQNDNGAIAYICTEDKDIRKEEWQSIVKLTGEYDGAPKLKPCPFCGKQPKIIDYDFEENYESIKVTCCNGIKTDIEGWEGRV